MSWKEVPRGRSIRCNGEALKLARLRRGWTQPELAQVAGLSIRALAKAEASETVHPDTIEYLAAALATAEHPVFPEDLTASPREIARMIMQAYAKHERQCVSHIQHFLAEDMTISCPGDPEMLPFAGERSTIDGFDDFWGAFFSIFERPDKKLITDTMQVIADGNKVVTLFREVTSFGGDKATDNGIPIAVLMTFERGKLKHFEDHFDVRSVQSDVRKIVQRNAVARNALLTATASG